jgi:hypothetical protein
MVFVSESKPVIPASKPRSKVRIGLAWEEKEKS